MSRSFRRGCFASAINFMRSDRFFYSTAAALCLLIMFLGFMPYYLSGHGQHGRVIAPALAQVVFVHGMAVTAWYLLSLVQALLISVKNRKLHMKLGWSAVALLPVVAVSGILVAVRSTEGAQNFVFFGMRYPDFLLVMLMEIAVFTLFVSAGILTRKKPEIHRSMMLLASLSLLLGATARMPWLNGLFGGDTRLGFFGPVFAFGVLLLLGRYRLTETFDRWFARGLAFMIIAFVGAERLSQTETWRHLAGNLLKG